jgi:hypothetical protein
VGSLSYTWLTEGGSSAKSCSLQNPSRSLDVQKTLKKSDLEVIDISGRDRKPFRVRKTSEFLKIAPGGRIPMEQPAHDVTGLN